MSRIAASPDCDAADDKAVSDTKETLQPLNTTDGSRQNIRFLINKVDLNANLISF
jgi:hypothetical protein